MGKKPHFPIPLLRVRYLKASPLLRRELAQYKPGAFGKVKRLRRNLHVLDAAYNQDGSLHSVKVALVQDHPSLPWLKSIEGAPKAIWVPFLRSNRLKYVTATDASVFSQDFGRAVAAWDEHWHG